MSSIQSLCDRSMSLFLLWFPHFGTGLLKKYRAQAFHCFYLALRFALWCYGHSLESIVCNWQHAQIINFECKLWPGYF